MAPGRAPCVRVSGAAGVDGGGRRGAEPEVRQPGAQGHAVGQGAAADRRRVAPALRRRHRGDRLPRRRGRRRDRHAPQDAYRPVGRRRHLRDRLGQRVSRRAGARHALPVRERGGGGVCHGAAPPADRGGVRAPRLQDADVDRGRLGVLLHPRAHSHPRRPAAAEAECTGCRSGGGVGVAGRGLPDRRGAGHGVDAGTSDRAGRRGAEHPVDRRAHAVVRRRHAHERAGDRPVLRRDADLHAHVEAVSRGASGAVP